LLVGAVVLLLPGRQFAFSAGSAVRDDQAGALVAAGRDGHRGADRSLGPRLLPAAGVVVVAGQRSADHHDQAGVGVDDDLGAVAYR
jgi:hypothetical protein